VTARKFDPYFGYPGGRPIWPWADWRDRSSTPADAAQTRKALRHGQALTAQGRTVSLAPRKLWAGSKLAKVMAAQRVEKLA